MKTFVRRIGWSDRFAAGMLTLCLADLLLVALTLWAVFGYRDATADRGDARKTVIALDAALISLIDAETGQRGFLITADERFLEPYRSGTAGVESALVELGVRLDSGSARTDLEALVPLIREKQAELAEVLALRTDGKPGSIQAAVAGARGKELMDEIRRRLSSLRTEAESRATEAQNRSDRLGNVLGGSSIAVAVLTVAMVTAMTFTLRRRVETEALRKAAAAKDEFVGFVSHELRGPIAVIAGNARLLGEDGREPLPAEAQTSLTEIIHGAERLESTLATLLSLAKAESGGRIEVEPVLIHRVAGAAVKHHGTRFPGREVRLLSPQLVPPVNANRDAVEQVLLNLLQNAEKYGDPLAPIQVEVVPGDDVVTCRVVNAGEQLDRAQFERAFEPFFRLSSTASSVEGVGLGLTVCHRLVAAQGGTMTAEAMPTGGACFSFRLPIAEESGDQG